METEKAKAGCMGCVYEDKPTCPADDGQLEFNFEPCTREGDAVIIKGVSNE